MKKFKLIFSIFLTTVVVLSNFTLSTNFAQATIMPEITSFDFSTPAVTGVIDDVNYTISLMVPNGTDVTALVPTIGVTSLCTTTPASGIAQDFTDPVIYTVTNDHSISQDYTVTVTVEPPTLESIAITSPASKLFYLVGSSLDLSDMAVTGTYSDGSTQPERFSDSNITGFDSSVASTSELLTLEIDGKIATYTISVADSQDAEFFSDTVVDPDYTNIRMTDDHRSSYNIVVSEDITSATLDLSPLMNGSNSAMLRGTVTIQATTGVGDVYIELPADTTFTADAASWDGIMHMPQIKENSSVDVPDEEGKTTEINSVIEIGLGDIKLTFDQAVKITIPGQAGKTVGYSRSGVYTEITSVCGSNSQAWADANLAAGADCKTDSGSDLIIWTKHFTKFVTVTKTSNNRSAGDGGLLIPSFDAPVGGFKILINNDIPETKTVNVTLGLNGGEAKTMAISNSLDFTGISQEIYQSTKLWVLPVGEGMKTVYAKFFDKNGTASEIVSDMIRLVVDKIEPIVPKVLGYKTPETKPVTPVVNQKTCGMYIRTYMRLGKKNDKNEVIKLQKFLNENLKKNIPVTGVFDKATDKAVREFQLKYNNNVLVPWAKIGLLVNGETSTGYVYKTTQRQINLLKCSSLNIPLPILN